MCDISETIQKSVQTPERHINHGKKFTSAWSERRRGLGTFLWLLPSTLFFAFQLRWPGCWMPRGNAEDNRAHCPWLCVVTSAPGSFITLMVVQTSGWPSQAHLLSICSDKTNGRMTFTRSVNLPKPAGVYLGRPMTLRYCGPGAAILITREDQRRHILQTLLGKGVLGIFLWSLTYFSSLHLLKSNRDEDSKNVPMLLTETLG